MRYFSANDEIREVRNGFKFRSLRSWPEFRGREFMIFDIVDSPKIIVYDDKNKIIRKIEKHKNMRAYLDSLFNWLNESISLYDGKFYKPV